MAGFLVPTFTVRAEALVVRAVLESDSRGKGDSIGAMRSGRTIRRAWRGIARISSCDANASIPSFTTRVR